MMALVKRDYIKSSTYHKVFRKLTVNNPQNVGGIMQNESNHKKDPPLSETLMLYKGNGGVGVAGFEPATSCSQSRRDNRATLHPEVYFSDPTRTRTWNLRFRKPLLYPVELWNHCGFVQNITFGGGTGIRTRGTLERYGSLANYWFKPLTHPTKRTAKINFY